MHIIAVDDERPSLQLLERAILSVAPGTSIACFESAEAALAHARESRVDVAFLDIEMDEMNGLLLAKRLKDLHGETNIIFVTGYNSYMGNAFDMHASGYVLKPISPERVAKELENLRVPVKHPDYGLRFQCFGSFEVFMDGKPVPFRRPKAKEALAYLVDRRGAGVSKKELAAVLWEDEPYTHSVQSHLYVLLTEITRALQETGADDIIVKRRGLYAVDTEKTVCDYYRYEMGDIAAVNSYRGEYMANYSWAEFTAGALTRKM